MTSEVQAQGRGNLKRVTGLVSSAKMEKTRVVAVTEFFRHPKYGKYIKRTGSDG